MLKQTTHPKTTVLFLSTKTQAHIINSILNLIVGFVVFYTASMRSDGVGILLLLSNNKNTKIYIVLFFPKRLC